MLDGLCDRIEEELGRSVKTVVSDWGPCKGNSFPTVSMKVLYRENLLLEGLKLFMIKTRRKAAAACSVDC